jgi:hypothetical protein
MLDFIRRIYGIDNLPHNLNKDSIVDVDSLFNNERIKIKEIKFDRHHSNHR